MPYLVATFQDDDQLHIGYWLGIVIQDRSRLEHVVACVAYTATRADAFVHINKIIRYDTKTKADEIPHASQPKSVDNKRNDPVG